MKAADAKLRAGSTGVARRALASDHLIAKTEVERLCLRELEGDGDVVSALDSDRPAWRRALTTFLRRINERFIELKQEEADEKTACWKLGSFEGQQRLARFRAGQDKERADLSGLRMILEGKKRDVTAILEAEMSFVSPTKAEYLEASVRRIEELLDLDPLKNEELQKWLGRRQ